MQIKQILVPVDFSPPSRLALNQGIAFARKFHARLTLLNVVEESTAVMYTFPTESARIDKEHHEQAWRMLSALLSPEDQDDLDLQILVKTGNIEEDIFSTIREVKADVVVMGTHGRGLLGRTFIGSVTQHMLRKVPVPILTVCRVARPLTFERILFATDFSDTSTHGFRTALELARVTHSKLTILHAVDVPQLTYANAEAAGIDIGQVLEEARVRLNNLAAVASTENIKVDTVLVEGNAAGAIFKAAEDNCADLIVISVGRKGLLERALLGSTAERVIRESHLPVLSIPVGSDAKSEN
jgi:nucleotide-binding universal stress UspA family protein